MLLPAYSTGFNSGPGSHTSMRPWDAKELLHQPTAMRRQPVAAAGQLSLQRLQATTCDSAETPSPATADSIFQVVRARAFARCGSGAAARLRPSRRRRRSCALVFGLFFSGGPCATPPLADAFLALGARPTGGGLQPSRTRIFQTWGWRRGSWISRWARGEGRPARSAIGCFGSGGVRRAARSESFDSDGMCLLRRSAGGKVTMRKLIVASLTAGRPEPEALILSALRILVPSTSSWSVKTAFSKDMVIAPKGRLALPADRRKRCRPLRGRGAQVQLSEGFTERVETEADA